MLQFTFFWRCCVLLGFAFGTLLLWFNPQNKQPTNQPTNPPYPTQPHSNPTQPNPTNRPTNRFNHSKNWQLLAIIIPSLCHFHICFYHYSISIISLFCRENLAITCQYCTHQRTNYLYDHPPWYHCKPIENLSLPTFYLAQIPPRDLGGQAEWLCLMATVSNMGYGQRDIHSHWKPTGIMHDDSSSLIANSNDPQRPIFRVGIPRGFVWQNWKWRSTLDIPCTLMWLFDDHG